MNGSISYEILFPPDWDAYLEYESTCKGYQPEVIVRFGNGMEFQMCFISISRVRESLEYNTGKGMNFFAECNMVVLSEVTDDNIKHAVASLVEQEFFFSELGPKRG